LLIPPEPFEEFHLWVYLYHRYSNKISHWVMLETTQRVSEGLCYLRDGDQPGIPGNSPDPLLEKVANFLEESWPLHLAFDVVGIRTIGCLYAHPSLGFKVWGSGFGVWVWGFYVWGRRVKDSGA
jgi:hypothetical protein